jgi:hypothetical protein
MESMTLTRKSQGWLVKTATCLAAVLLAGSCDKHHGQQQTASGKQPAETYQPEVDPVVLEFQAKQQQMARARELRLVDPRQQLNGVPVAWDLASDGSSLLALVPAAAGGDSTAYSVSLARPDLPPAKLGSYHALRAFIAASSNGRAALVSSLESLPSGALADKYWWLSPESEGIANIAYLKAGKLPRQLAADALESRSSFVAADDTTIVVPVGCSGLAVAGLDGRARYVACPDFDSEDTVEPQGISCGRLPSLDGNAYIYVSQFAVVVGGRKENGAITPVREEYCQVSILNLSQLRWERTERFDWTVVEVGSPDFRTAEWTLLGSRPRADTAEASDRMARVRRYSPDIDLDLDLPVLNGLAWDPAGMHLAADGQRIVYRNPEVQGVSRVSAAGGAPENDKRCYLAGAKLLIDASGETAVLVQDDIAVRCEFAESK